MYVDEDGRIVKPPLAKSGSKDEELAELTRWVEGEPVVFEAAGSGRDSADPRVREADLRYALGSLLLQQGKTEEAMDQWRAALELDPGNWIIHKQIWAVEHPEAFYEGAVDYGWQKEQLEREAEGEG
jgi:hypothetical protein